MSSFKVHSAIQKYFQQQDRSKISAKIMKTLGISVRSQDKVSISPQAQKMRLITTLTNDIVNNLIVGNQEKPSIVEEIKHELEKEFGEELFFKFDPKEKSVTVRRRDNREFSEKEREAIIQRLWEITHKKVKSLVE